MKLRPGKWQGRGSFLRQGQSRGVAFDCTFTVSSDTRGTQIAGNILVKEPSSQKEFSIWITPDDVGTYTLMATIPGWSLRGTAKLESLPHLALLWSEDGKSSVAATLLVRVSMMEMVSSPLLAVMPYRPSWLM